MRRTAERYSTFLELPSGGPAAAFAKAPLAQAAAWAPNPGNPPDFFDPPYDKDGELDATIADKWLANSPLVMVDQYVPSLKRYRAIALDVGNEDPLRADNVNLDAALTRLGVGGRCVDIGAFA